MEFLDINSQKVEDIKNNTYIIRFFLSQNEDKGKNDITKEHAFICEPIEPGSAQETTLLNAVQKNTKTIVKLEIVGHAMLDEKYIKRVPLFEELFDKIMSRIDLNEKIVLIKNATCHGAGHLMSRNDLIEEDNDKKCWNEHDPEVIDDKQEILSKCKQLLVENKVGCFYYGFVDKYDDGKFEVRYINKLFFNGDKIDDTYFFDVAPNESGNYFGNTWDGYGNKEKENEFIDLLHTDLQNLLSKKKELPKPEDKKVSLKNNCAKTDLAIPATTKQEENNIQCYVVKIT